jgi:hypothetical protein
MATTHEPLQLDKRKIVDMPTDFITITIFFNVPFGLGGISKL